MLYSSANARETLAILSSVAYPSTSNTVENPEPDEPKAKGEKPESLVTQTTDCAGYEK
jgi:hypothetical protein